MHRLDYIYRETPSVGAKLELREVNGEWYIFEGERVLATGPRPDKLRLWAWAYPIQELRHPYDLRGLEK